MPPSEGGVRAQRLEPRDKTDIAALEVKIDSKIEKLRSELKADMAALEAKLVRWMFAALAGQTVILVGLMRLFMPHGL